MSILLKNHFYLAVRHLKLLPVKFYAVEEPIFFVNRTLF